MNIYTIVKVCIYHLMSSHKKNIRGIKRILNSKSILLIKNINIFIIYCTNESTPDTEESNNSSNCDAYDDEKDSPKQCVQHNYNNI